MMIIEKLKSRNRTLLEIDLGLIFWGIVATAVGAVLPLGEWGLPKKEYFFGLWVACLLATAAVLHMQRCLDKALDWDEKTASKMIYRGYMIRYTSFAVFAVATTILHLLDPVVLCLGYLLLMKVAVYSQPFTHKLCNKLFHETDPIPEAVQDGELQEIQNN